MSEGRDHVADLVLRAAASSWVVTPEAMGAVLFALAREKVRGLISCRLICVKIRFMNDFGDGYS